MNTAWIVAGIVGVACILSIGSLAAFAQNHREGVLNARVLEFFKARAQEFDTIPSDRKADLDSIANYVRTARSQGHTPRLMFVCTHNSRRSHMGQILAAAAAQAAGFTVETSSAGTEATAFNPRAVAAIERAGFAVRKTTTDTNPIYHVSMGDGAPVVTCFSKRIDNAPNPTAGFAAVMVCTEADKACPSVAGADARFALPYVDPKVADNTPDEARAYDERCAQIAREMMYVMQQASK